MVNGIRPRIFFSLLAVGGCLLAAAAANAQSAASAASSSAAAATSTAEEQKRTAPADSSPAPDASSVNSHLRPVSVNVDVVLVPVTVSDSRNHPVVGLERKDFSLFADSAQQAIRYFSTEDAPISLGVLLDVSGSMKDKIDIAREAVLEFFKNSNPEDDYFVITFSDDPAVLADSTRSIAYVQNRMAEAQAAGHTSLLDAIYLGLNKMRNAQYQRRALLVISDGGDNHSRYSAREIKRMVEEADVEIYAIGIFGTVFRTPEEWGGKRLLTSITEATGGRTFSIRNAAELPAAATAVSHELRLQYVLGYQPPPAARDGKWHKLKVQVRPQHTAERLQVSNKSGYQAY